MVGRYWNQVNEPGRRDGGETAWLWTLLDSWCDLHRPIQDFEFRQVPELTPQPLRNAAAGIAGLNAGSRLEG
jgi:hypothetical protein